MSTHHRNRYTRHILNLERLEDRTVPAAPVNSFPGTQTVIEENPLVFSAANGNGLSFTDSDGPGPYQVELAILKNPNDGSVVGQLSVASTAGVTITGNGTNALTLLGNFADVHTALDTLVLLPAIDVEGQLRLVFETHDDGAGGQVDNDFVLINVTPNQSPINITPGTQTTSVNTPLPFSTATNNRVAVTDPDGPGLFQIEITLVDTAAPPQNAGILSLANVNGLTVSGNNTNNMIIVGSLADVNTALETLVYHPETSYTGQARIIFEAHDSNVSSTRSDTNFITINVINNPSPSNVDFSSPSIAPESIPITISGSFTNPDGDAHTVTIDFGDGSTPVTLNLAAGEDTFTATHTYLDDDPSGTSFDVKNITATVSDGVNSAQRTRQIEVHNIAPQIVTLSATPTFAGGSSTITINFIDPGTLDPKLIAIDFGDGSPILNHGVAPGASNATITHIYSTVGTFTVTATVNDDDLGSSAPGQTTVNVADPVPVITPPASQSSTEGASTQFQLGSFVDANNSGFYAINVNWGDGTANTFFNQSTTGAITPQNHIYAQDGNYTVTITVEDINGLSTPVTFQATVSNVLPFPSSLPTQTANSGVAQSFILGSFTDPGADGPWTVEVIWGDGSPNTEFQVNAPGAIPNQDHTYATPGNFTLVVNIRDDDGTGQVHTTVIVANSLPVITPPVPQATNEGASTQFLLGAFVDANNSGNYTVTVNWGDGTPNTVFNQATPGAITQQNHTFAQDGVFTVTVTVADVDGTSDPASFQASVSNVTPDVTPAGNQNGVATIAQSFNLGSFIDPGADQPWTVTVNWGDGSADTVFAVNSPGMLPSQSHTYATAGTFTVTVTINDDDSTSANRTFTVNMIPPEAHILGNVFRDFNRDGSFNTVDKGQQGVVVFADVNGNGALDNNEPNTTTDLDGNYDLTVGFEGGVNVRQVVPEGFIQTTDNPGTVNVNFGDTVSVEALGLGRIVKPVLAIAGRTGTQPFVQVRGTDGTLRFQFTPFPTIKISLKEVRLATGDANDDGTEDIYVVPGPGIAGVVKVFSGIDGSLIRTWAAYPFPHTKGLSLATSDITGDGVPDVFLGTDKGVSPLVTIWDGKSEQLIRSFVAPNANSKTGVKVTLGDINGDGIPEVITAPGVGYDKTNIRIMAHDVYSGVVLQNFAIKPTYRGDHQLALAAGDLDGDGLAEVMLTSTRSGLTELRTYQSGLPVSTVGSTSVKLRTNAFNLAAKDINGDGVADLLFAGASGQAPRLKALNVVTGQTILNALLLGSTQKNGLIVG